MIHIVNSGTQQDKRDLRLLPAAIIKGPMELLSHMILLTEKVSMPLKIG